MKTRISVAIVLFATTTLLAGPDKPGNASRVAIVGYLRDAACVHRSPKITKPLANGCLEACLRSGSPLVVLTSKGEVYQPISPEMPDRDMRAKLLPYAGKLVKVTGHVFERGGSRAIAVETIEEETE